ncbi:Phytoene/squalene synthetase-like protein [Candidatus Rhodobacter oscarellae]|uniref:Phytoene/squalene synthetase-like protein n=1 Tax=Candidatus Rhodobacter oscarellae TaxID=1675527 RepID=A0A0J9GVC4_9RHOB|nr:squalene/phytoene synthase family protein [Candidatus Rhodobacter lobularis]KMW57523.1 Phytoene/squalene synthetase-like protein [Candidatus Rhodobacter lobularis]
MSLDQCAEIVRRGDPDRFLATMAAPVAARRVLLPLYAFNIEVARAPWVTAEPMIAEMRLQWWRDALEEVRTGSTVRNHEVTTPLAEVLDAEGAAILDRLVQARRWDIYRDPFEDVAHFWEHLDATSGGLAWACARALGATEGEARVRAIARAAGLANWFQAIPELEARGRVPLVDGRPEAVAALAREGLALLSGPRPDPAARAALLASWRARPILRMAERRPDLVASGGLVQSEFARRWGLIWRSLVG